MGVGGVMVSWTAFFCYVSVSLVLSVYGFFSFRFFVTYGVLSVGAVRGYSSMGV